MVPKSVDGKISVGGLQVNAGDEDGGSVRVQSLILTTTDPRD
jgi:hypothetical protein